MISAFIPGPWAIQTRDGRLPEVIKVKMPHGEASTFRSTIWAGGDIVCRLDFGYGRPTDLANARLIAAAPELLAALLRISDSTDECGCTHDTEDCCNHVGVFCAKCIAASAVAKVNGVEVAK